MYKNPSVKYFFFEEGFTRDHLPILNRLFNFNKTDGAIHTHRHKINDQCQRGGVQQLKKRNIIDQNQLSCDSPFVCRVG